MRDGGRTLEYTLFGGKSLAPALVNEAYKIDTGLHPSLSGPCAPGGELEGTVAVGPNEASDWAAHGACTTDRYHIYAAVPVHVQRRLP
jgi:hypothetical protein